MGKYKEYPIVSIVGRPNVGKSSIFNRIIKSKTAIVDVISGVTRDRLYADVTNYDKPFCLVDTGGIVLDEKDFFSMKIKEQAEIAILESSVILFVVDGKEGLNPLDAEVSSLLRKNGKNIFLVINKVDNAEMEMNLTEFYKLGYDHIYCVSAIQNRNIIDMMDDVVALLPNKEVQTKESSICIAVVGRPNVGKSSFVNKVLNEDRVIVSEVPGTTRDAVDVNFKKDNQLYTFIDTAGMRYKNKIKDDLDYYSFNRAQKSIKRSDVVILMIDAAEGLTTLELKILEEIKEHAKPCILVLNKWDKFKDVHQKDYFEENLSRMKSYAYVPCMFISAIEGQNINKIFHIVDKIIEEQKKRITTGVLNQFFTHTLEKTPPAIKKGKRFKIYYACQVETGIPTFVIQANSSHFLDNSYKKFLENRMRAAFGFYGLPIRMLIRNKKKE